MSTVFADAVIVEGDGWDLQGNGEISGDVLFSGAAADVIFQQGATFNSNIVCDGNDLGSHGAELHAVYTDEISSSSSLDFNPAIDLKVNGVAGLTQDIEIAGHGTLSVTKGFITGWTPV